MPSPHPSALVCETCSSPGLLPFPVLVIQVHQVPIPFLVSEVRPMLTLARRAATIAALLPLAMAPVAGQRVQIKLDPSIASGPLTGRVFVFFSRNETREPRLQGGSYGGSAPFFGLDVSA